MLYQLNATISLFVVVPAITGCIRLPRIRQDFYPFIALLNLGLLNELFNLLLSWKTGNTSISYNIAGLLFSLVALWQFHCWGACRIMRRVCRYTGGLLVLVWLLEYGHHQTPFVFFSFFTVVRNGLLLVPVFYFIEQRLASVTYRICQDAVFLACCGWVLFFIYGLILELLLLYGGQYRSACLHYLIPLFALINLGVLFIHLYAVLCIPPRTPC